MALELTTAHTCQAKARSSHCAAVGWVLVTTFQVLRSRFTASAFCTKSPPSIERTSRWRAEGADAEITRRFFFANRTSSASASNDGATTTSVNTGASASAISRVTARFTATIPPKALTGSQALASEYACAIEPCVDTATPHGLACFTITHDALAN
ncbi:unannotated protein [freshwater metagenome]|uniref:Unannotated protein n=1 Tax=freshwater metagenome TaxID=449393 RepID=A0A6J6BBM8_9ZZZZ